MSFLEELQKETNKTYTENGAVTNKSSLNHCLDFFALAASMRNNKEDAIKLFEKAFLEDKQTAIRILFWIRDVRGGQGEREIFKSCFNKLHDLDFDTYEKVLEYVPEYGRWDDIVNSKESPKVYCDKLVYIIKSQLNKDLLSDTPSLLAKWLPSENASSKVTRENAINLASSLNMTPKQYRKTLSKLRKKIHLLEQDMSSNNWNEIKYDKIPSQAFRKHISAFNRHDKDRFEQFLDDVHQNKKKLNTSTITTEEVFNTISKDVKASNVIWESLENVVPEDLNAIVVADVSGSMSGRPMKICTSLALYFAERNKGEFANKFITFSEHPELVEVLGDTLEQKLRNIECADWENNTNLEAVFNLLLKAAKNSRKEEIPRVIYIISDMEFDGCVDNSNDTVFENARKQWNESGLELPTVVFWNVSARNIQTAATKFDKNVSLISGSNQSSFKLAFENKTPIELMNETVNSERYSQIVIK